MNLAWMLLALVSLWAQASLGYYRLKPLSYTQFPTRIISNIPRYEGLNRNAVTAAAYDYHNDILYVIGKENHLLHVVDIIDPTNPTVLLTHQFETADGVPKSMSVCDGELAVGLEAMTDVNEGHVIYYKTYTRGSGAKDLTLEGFITVGAHPDHIQYTADCGSIVVPNEGEPGKNEAGAYRDPEGTVAIIHSEKVGNPSVKHVDFQAFNNGQPKYRADLRAASRYIPTSVLPAGTSVSQDLEPEYAAISANMRTAWITLPSSNAVAEVDLVGGIVNNIYSLPLKDWTGSAIDASDRDGGVHRRLYPGLKSLRQPSVIKPITIGRKTFLVMAEEGEVKSFTRAAHGFDWTDSVTAKSLVNTIDDPFLKEAANDDERLGRLQVSTIDGRGVLGHYDNLVAFGGRGFSIWDSSDFTRPVFDSDGTLEEYSEAYNKAVFNTGYLANTLLSPEQLRDTVSENMGAQVTGMDLKTSNGTMFLVVGTSSTGTLYLYTVDLSSGQPAPSFQSVYRTGVTDLPWNDLYTNKSAGDLYISDIGIITGDQSPIDRPLVYVISKGAGAMSLYEIEEVHTVIGRK